MSTSSARVSSVHVETQERKVAICIEFEGQEQGDTILLEPEHAIYIAQEMVNAVTFLRKRYPV